MDNTIEFTQFCVPFPNKSIYIPDGKLKKMPQKYIKSLSKDGILKQILLSARERSNCCIRNFPCIKFDDLYLIWIEKITKWIVVYYKYDPKNIDTELPYIDGPFDIGEIGADIIKGVYCSSISHKDICKTSPEALLKK